ncbi:DUF397 domain-containing protein [Nocardiopsis gilva YIM 90087]|uniref:DUF397 domain-containing protein n=1 Tax=Nocardiopsis gilva YIM 90087 TaxID=1235441 RepID=A0A223S6V5_9ACTN|nr:DUF397 domain-containing protein [Nocardiopsis gilva]ASU83851.1 DUF397 domain-containing protein [Nocardiopsis gilva YIM 90087]
MNWYKSSYSQASGDCVEVAWHKSTHRAASNPNCVEVAWHKSSYSGPNDPNCVEIAETPGTTFVRDTQHRHLGALAFGATEWRSFVDGLKRGDLA